jgi:hypothetical protein
VYDVRDLGSFLIMLAVLPVFLVVFALSIAILSPVLVLGWLLERWRERLAGVVQ